MYSFWKFVKTWKTVNRNCNCSLMWLWPKVKRYLNYLRVRVCCSTIWVSCVLSTVERFGYFLFVWWILFSHANHWVLSEVMCACFNGKYGFLFVLSFSLKMLFWVRINALPHILRSKSIKNESKTKILKFLLCDYINLICILEIKFVLL